MNIRKALTVRPSSIGDSLMGKFFLENIHAAYPDARLALVVGSRAGMIRNLFLGEEWLEVREANRRDLSSVHSLWKDFGGADIVLTYYTSSVINISTKIVARMLARRGGLIGFSDSSMFNRFIYDKIVQIFGRETSTRRLECEALTAAGVPITIKKLSLSYVPIAGVAAKFNICGPYIIVHLFSGSKSRGLTTERMITLLEGLAIAMPGTTLVLSGGAGDAAEAAEAVQGLSAVVIAGKASLQELMNLIVGSLGVVSLDTGVGHIAAHLGSPLVIMSTCLGKVGWWGPDQYGPGTPTALFCRDDLCKAGHAYKYFPDCLNEIDMAEVAKRAAAL